MLASDDGEFEKTETAVRPLEFSPTSKGSDQNFGTVVPDAHLLFSGDFKRVGLDLILSDAERQFIVRDYFKGEKHPTLLSPDGASLSGNVVDALTGHAEYAQAGPAAGVAKVIGQVVKLNGSATAIRNGVAVELNIGDNVHKGDVVQSRSESALGISFIDGTAFSLSSNARMVLDDVVYDPNGLSNSSLLSLVQGTISFVAGETAKNGNMRIDTPVATMGIRGTAVLVEISADNGPTKFSVLVEPGGRVGSYTLTDKRTGLPIGTISQPGLVTIVSATGINRPVTVVELQKTSTDLLNEMDIVKLVFSIAFPQFNFDDTSPKSTKFAGSSGNNLADGGGLGKVDGTTTPFKVAVSEISKPTGSTVPASDFTTEVLRVAQATQPLSDASTLIEDSVATHLDLTAAGAFLVTGVGIIDTRNATISLKSSTSTAHLPGYINNISQIGSFALGEIANDTSSNTATVGWTFTLADNDPVLQSLAKGQSLTQIYTIIFTDSNGALVTRDVTVTLIGTNDNPTIVSSINDAPTLTEDSLAASLDLSAVGTITFRDVDSIDTHNATIALRSSTSNAHLPGFTDNVSQIGVFVLTSGPVGVSEITTDTNDTATVSWSFKVAYDDPVLQLLALDQTVTQVYTITVADNNGALVTQDVKLTLIGANDSPIITGEDLSGELIQQLTSADYLTDSGGISFTDVDLTDVHLVSATGIPVGSAIGTLTVVMDDDTTGTGKGGHLTWTYTVADTAIAHLAKNQTKVESFTITLADQNGGVITRKIDVTIKGTDDAALITGTATGAVKQDGALTAAGTLTVSDVDSGEDHFQVVTPASLLGTYGSFTFDVSTGVWSYTLDNASANVQSLPASQVVHDTLTVKSADGTASQQIDVTITGSNDAPTILGGTDPSMQAVIVVRPVAPVALVQGTNTNSLGLQTETFDSQIPGSLSNTSSGSGNFTSVALDAIFSGSGNAGIINGSSGFSVAIFVGPSGAKNTTNYLNINAGETETITFAVEKNAFGLYWGSVDPFNTIEFYNGTTLVASYTGADIIPLFSANQGPFLSNGYVEFSNLTPFNRVVLGSGSNAFEIDNISAGSVPATHVQLLAPISGTLTVSDVDIGDVLTASVTESAVISYNGSTQLPVNIDIAELIAASAVTFGTAVADGGTEVLHWTYDPINPNLDFLRAGDTLTITFTARVSDGHATVGNQSLTITIVGAASSADLSNFNVLSGTSGNDTFNNVGDNQTIFGGDGHDTFVFNAGFSRATLADFDINNDSINIDHTLFADVAAILASAQAANAGADTIITDLANNTITLEGVTLAQVQAHAASFHLI